MITVAERTFPDDTDELRHDPLAVLTHWDDVTLQLLPDMGSTDQTQSCSVAGAYIEGDDTSPAQIRISLSASHGRRAFTALHELGHHLQRTDAHLARVIWEQGSRDLFEDLACDEFAAQMLLPDSVVDQSFGDRGPTAHDLVSLYSRTSASRSAVCVQAARRLPAPGHVLLLTEDGEIFFSSSKDLPPLRRGSDQSKNDVLARGLSAGSSRGRGRFRYRDGITGQELFIQTTMLDGFLAVVAVTDRAPWESFALPSRDVGPRGSSYECPDPACGATYVSFEARCPRCEVPPCRDCGRCSCRSAVAERTCSACWLLKPAAGFVGEICADCA